MTDQPLEPGAAPITAEIATSENGRDITLGFMGALLEVQDTVLRRLGSNYEVYRELRRDGQVHACFQQRRLALKARALVVEPGGEDPASIAAADSLRENLEQIGLDRAFGLMMWGAFYGYSVGECMWERRDRRIWLQRIKVRTPWRFRFSAADGGLRLLTRSNMIQGEPMPPAKFWTTSWGADNDDDAYGLGLAHQLYWPVFFKKQGLAFWLRALEKFGAPTASGTYPRDADKQTQDKLLRALHRMRMDGAIIMPEGTTATLLEATRGTVDQATFHRQMNAEISKIILGQTMTTDDGASYSQSEVHMEVREELTDADVEELCESFMIGPAAWLTQWNFPGAATPRVSRPAPEDEGRSAELIAAKAGAVAAMKAAGYEPTPETENAMFGEGWVRAKTPPPPPGTGAAFAEPGGPADAIEAFVAEFDWEPLMEEPVAFIERFLEGCDSLEEARDRLPGLLATLPTERLRVSMARANLEAALAGRADVPISDEEAAARADG